ncbi:phage baseplate plug family protein [Providencia rettgeri]|uniref:phage baseplate plug family protein n=1 Tax=Providencia rettgeri TaxID=587 RepID=UPI004057A02D
MITEIPLLPIPNQIFSFTNGTDEYEVELNSRLDSLYATVKKNNENVVCNRICRNMTYICQWLIFADQQGNTDPVYTDLGSRYRLIWADGI